MSNDGRGKGEIWRKSVAKLTRTHEIREAGDSSERSSSTLVAGVGACLVTVPDSSRGDGTTWPSSRIAGGLSANLLVSQRLHNTR
jgi:hypothetical protein